jgi:hypothetical protein
MSGSERSGTRKRFLSSLDYRVQHRQMFRLLSSCLSSFCCAASNIDCCCCSVCSAGERGENCWAGAANGRSVRPRVQWSQDLRVVRHCQQHCPGPGRRRGLRQRKELSAWITPPGLSASRDDNERTVGHNLPGNYKQTDIGFHQIRLHFSVHRSRQADQLGRCT